MSYHCSVSDGSRPVKPAGDAQERNTSLLTLFTENRIPLFVQVLAARDMPLPEQALCMTRKRTQRTQRDTRTLLPLLCSLPLHRETLIPPEGGSAG